MTPEDELQIEQLRARIELLKKRLRKSRRRVEDRDAEIAALKSGGGSSGPAVSPLAPKDGFPDLPEIKGVSFAAIEAGVRYTNRLDVMLARIEPGASVAGVFTRSATRAGPVIWCEELLSGPLSKTTDAPTGIVVNSGNANAFTGGQGLKDVKAVAKAAGKALGCPAEHVLIASTGVIGEQLPAHKITDKMADLNDALAPSRAADAACAIMTTDTYPKGASVKVVIDGAEVTISGFAKGSGMIAPDMATMLVFIFTDAKIKPSSLRAILAEQNQQTFNAITVDGDTSTSDSLIVAATGQAEMERITSAKSEAGRAFAAALGGVMKDLAHQVVRDGEGATKFVEIQVTGAASDASAHKVGLAIANSPLVKTALAGEDPNWGRIVMAVGKSGEPAERDQLTIHLGDILVAEKGWVAESYTEAEGAAYMKNEDLIIRVDLGLDAGQATVWTCDLTHQYISINADYRS